MANQRASNRNPEVLALHATNAVEAARDVNVDGEFAVGTEARRRLLTDALETVLEEDRDLLVELASR